MEQAQQAFMLQLEHLLIVNLKPTWLLQMAEDQ